MKYLLDTNATIGYIRQKDMLLVSRIASTPQTDLVLCTVVLCELYYGAYHSGAANVTKNLQLIENIRPKFCSVGFSEQAAEEFGKVRAHLSSIGQVIGPYDMLIAATARAHNLILVTHNTHEFSRVPGLQVEDWQTP